MEDTVSPLAVPTVSVVGQDGNELRINRADFDADPSKWKEWGEPSAPSNSKTGKPQKKRDGSDKAGATADNTLTVVNKDGRFFIADGDGVVIEDDARYNHTEGYATDADAWTAAYAAPT